MSFDENQKAEIESGDSQANSTDQVLKPIPKKRKLADLGIGTTLVIGGILGLLWLNRSLVSQNAIVWALASKGVESHVEVESFSSRGLKFKQLRIGKSSEETIIANNGAIDWHYEFGNGGLIIDNISGKEIFGNFAITRNGIDFRALSPLMKTEGTKKPLLIKNIDIENAKINIDTPYGLLRAHLGLHGAQNKGFSGLAKIFAPQQFLLNQSYYERPIYLGFRTGAFESNRPSFIGLSAQFKDLSFSGGSVLADLEAQRVDANINGAIILKPNSSRKAENFYTIYPSQIEFARFSPLKNMDFLNGTLNVEKGYLNPNQNILTESIISLNGGLDFGYANFGNINLNNESAIENLRGKFEIARAEDGTSFASAIMNLGPIRGPAAIQSGTLGLKVNTIIPAFDKVAASDLSGRITIDGKLNRVKALNSSSAALNQYGFGDLEKTLGLGLSANFSKTKDRVLIALSGAQNLYGAQKSQITFIPFANSAGQASQSGISLVQKGDNWAFEAFGAGALKGANNQGARFNAKIDLINLRASQFAFRAHDIDFQNLPFASGFASGNLNAADYSQINQSRNANIDGKITLRQNGEIKLSPSELRLRARMLNNHGEIALSGGLNDFSGFGAKFDKSNLSLSGAFDFADFQNHSRLAGNFIIDNQTSRLEYQNQTKLAGIAANGNIEFDLNLAKGGKKSSSVNLLSNGLLVSANSINSGGFSASNFSANSPFSLSGTFGGANQAAFLAQVRGLGAKASKFASEEIKGSNFALNGSANIIGQNGNMQIGGDTCLGYSIDSLSVNSNSLGKTIGRICPDEKSRFAQFGDGKMSLFANTQTDDFKIQMGDRLNGQNLELGRIAANFSPRENGAIGIKVSTEKFNFRFKSGPDSWAQIYSPSAKIDISAKPSGSDFTISLDNLIAKDLPILAEGAASGKFHSDAQTGLSGEFRFNNIQIQDSQPLKRFGDLTLDGSGRLANNKVSINAETKNTEIGAPLAAFTLYHDINSGKGSVDFEGAQINFTPFGNKPLDARHIVPALRGVVEDAYGKINGNANFSWAPNQPIKSSGVFSTDRFDFETPLGPVDFIKGSVALSDLIQIKSDGRQNLQVGRFNPGIPIVNGDVGLSFPGDNSINLDEASWPFADGILRIRSFNWPFDQKDRDLTIDVDNIDIAKFLLLTKIPNLEIDGRLSGFLPVQIRDNDVSIVGGVLRAREGGGVFRYTGPDATAPKPRKTGAAKLKERIFGKPTPQGVDLAITALRKLNYKVLEVRVDGRITGDLKIGVLLEGYNEELLNGHTFRFNVNILLPLIQAMEGVKGVMDPNKSFNILNPDGTIKDGIEIEGDTITPKRPEKQN